MGSTLSSLLDLGKIMDSYIYQPPTFKPSYYEDMMHHVYIQYGVNKLHGCFYYPPQIVENLKHIDMTNTEQIRFQQRVWEKVIIFSHGNASDVESLHDFAKEFVLQTGITLFLYDYFGYGHSDDLFKIEKNLSSQKRVKISPSEESCHTSLQLVIQHLERMGYQSINMLLMGQSLGTGVVIDYCYRHDWSRPIILISPFESICRLVSENILLLTTDKYINIHKVPYLKCPVKIFHGIDDTVVPVSHSHVLYELTKHKSQKIFYRPTYYHGIGHNNILPQLMMEDFIPYFYIQEEKI